MFNHLSIRFLIRVWIACMAALFCIGQATANNPPATASQTSEQARAKSAGCESCHSYAENAGEHRTMHVNRAVILGCTDCHGGKASIVKPNPAANKGDALYDLARNEAHVQSKFPNEWKSGGTRPERTYTLLNRESPAFVRFINPGDYRVAREACGTCHLPIIEAAERSLMATGAMFWNGAAYNNGVLPFKRGILGESYTSMGLAGTLLNPVVPDALMKSKGILEKVHPTPTWETVAPADVFRVFERGGRVISSQFPEVGLPNSSGGLQKLDEPGRPDIKQSNRGPATGSRISIPLLNIAKTRLNDPMAWFSGTNDQPGDYRASGCSSCHSIYANDREPRHSGPYAVHGNSGLSASSDPTIAKDKSGHALKHTFSRAIP